MPAVRAILLSLAALALAACTPKQELAAVPEPLGDFKLQYSVAVVDKPEILPLSRKAEDAAWKAALETAMNERFSRFQGTGNYVVAIKLQAYALAQPGIPIVASPKSVVLIGANVWRAEGRINPKSEDLIVWEGLNGNSVIGSGLTQSKEQQMKTLAFNTAFKIEEWMRKNPDWFREGGPVALTMAQAKAENAKVKAEAAAKVAAAAAAAAAPAQEPAPAN